MVKFLTRVEVNVGHETYKLLIESENRMDYNDNHYYIDDALISEVKLVQNNSNTGPFAAKQFYQRLKFPMQSTMYSEQKFEYGGEDKSSN
jgi:hypothetical protein